MSRPSLAGPFVAHLRAAAEGAARPALDVAALEAKLEALVAHARAAWPLVELPGELFAAGLAARLDTAGDPLAGLDGLRAADLWLALACSRGDAAALRAFDGQLLSRVPQLIRRVDPQDALAAEVQQELRDQLFVPRGAGQAPRIADYSGRGDLLGWLRVVALRTALKLRRTRQRHGGEPREIPAGAGELQSGADPERDYLKLRYRGDYEAAFQSALDGLGAAERLLLKLHYVDALSLERLAALYRCHRATVARRLAEARRGLLEATRARLRETLGLSDSEFESVLALVRSQLAVSVRTALSQ